MWDDDDITKKKFELGRIIERDFPDIQKDLQKLTLNEDSTSRLEQDRIKANRLENQQRGRVIKTTNIDFFLNCENMDLNEIDKKMTDLIEDEQDPEWDDVELKDKSKE